MEHPISAIHFHCDGRAQIKLKMNFDESEIAVASITILIVALAELWQPRRRRDGRAGRVGVGRLNKQRSTLSALYTVVPFLATDGQCAAYGVVSLVYSSTNYLPPVT